MNSSVSNLNQWLFRNSDYSNDDVILKSAGQSVSFNQLKVELEKHTSVLQANRVCAKDKIAICLPNCVEYVTWLLAIWEYGAVPVLINTRLGEQEIIDLAGFADSKLLIFSTTNEVNPEIREISSLAGSVETDPFNSSSDALFIFTSGSLGKPKCVVHSFDNLYNSFSNTSSSAGFIRGEKFLASLPFYHIGGLMIIVRALASGGILCLPDSLKTDDISKSLNSFDPEYISLVPTMLLDLINSGSKPNKNIKNVFVGGGPATKNNLELFSKSGWPVSKVYGSSETCSMITYLSPEDFRSKPDSAGKPLPGDEIKLSENSEILVSSNTLFTNYYKRNDLYKRVTSGRWFNTGDIGKIDNDGFLYVESRRKDLIISGGENISPAEIENVLTGVFGIKDCVVFPEDNEKWGQIVCAAVSMQSPDQNAANSIITFAMENLPSFKRPKKYYIFNSLPKNEMGKVILNESAKNQALYVVEDF